MKDLDKGKCVRPSRRARSGTAHLNGIVALSEKSAEQVRQSLSRITADNYCARLAQAGTRNRDLFYIVA